MSVIYNTNYLNNIILNQNININIEYINISNRLIEFVNKNRIFLFLFKGLKINYLELVKNFILSN